MNILLDTHIYIWCLENNKRLSKAAKELITNANVVYVSTVSLFEVAIKIQKGKLKVDMSDLIKEISKSGFHELPLTADHTKVLSTLPRHHGDPFDHILISQAMSEPLQFLTADQSLTAYSELVITA